MTYAVTFGGIRCYSGKLVTAYRYIEQRWGSCALAWKAGVKIEPIADR